jgi:DNA-directed RNA polymerase
MKVRTATISPFAYSKAKLNFKVSSKDEYDRNKQITALMPNLIHSLDSTSLCMLYEVFSSKYNNVQFYSIHDCFGTTAEKVDTLKRLLTSVYVDLYSDDHYLINFDNDMFANIEKKTGIKIDPIKRKLKLLDGTSYKLHDINWVLSQKSVDKRTILKIDQQNILI